MSMQTDRLLNGVALLGFLVIFPGFVVYHYAVSASWIPMVLGGLFGGASLIISMFGLLHLVLLFQSPRSQALTIERLFTGVTLYFLIWTLLACAAIAARPYVLPALKEAVSTLAIWIAVFFIAARLQLERPGVVRIGMFSAAVVVALMLHSMVSHGTFLGPFMSFQAGDDTGGSETGAAAYQAIGRSILVVGVVLAAIQQRFWQQQLVLALALVLLLCLGSRAHLFACGALLAGMTLLGSVKRGARVPAFVLLIALCIAGYAMVDLFLSTRASEILDLSQSSSWQARLDLQQRALDVIRDDPFLGDFGYHHRGGPLSGYAHNVLSAWAEFGGLSFFVYLGFICYALWISALQMLFRSHPGPRWVIAFQFNAVALLLAITSEPIYVSVFPALGWGFLASALRADSMRGRRVVFRRARLVDESDPTVTGTT